MLTVKNLKLRENKEYENDSINFNIDNGKILGVICADNSTTELTDILSCQENDFLGEVALDGINLSSSLYNKKRVGVFLRQKLKMKNLTVKEMLDFCCDVRKVKCNSDDLCSRFSLSECQKNFINDLSSFENFKLRLALSFIGKTRLIVLYFAPCDLSVGQLNEVHTIIKKQFGDRIVVVSSVGLNSVYNLCDDFLFLHESKEVAFETRKTVRSAFALTSKINISFSGNDYIKLQEIKDLPLVEKFILDTDNNICEIVCLNKNTVCGEIYNIFKQTKNTVLSMTTENILPDEIFMDIFKSGTSFDCAVKRFTSKIKQGEEKF